MVRPRTARATKRPLGKGLTLLLLMLASYRAGDPTALSSSASVDSRSSELLRQGTGGKEVSGQGK